MNKIFENLFTLDMANNHQGSVEHGLRIIREHGAVVKKHGIKAAIKFQYRQLETFIHPDFKDSTENKHIPRFRGTYLKPEQYKTMVDEVKKEGMVTMCTPFDEESVDVIMDHGIEIIKIASCSAADWPLLEKIAATKKPVIVSTGGLSIPDVDKLVSFFTHRKVDFAIMHCVAIYPTEVEDLNLERITALKERYPFALVGYSTHEDPDNLDAVKMAIAKGAVIQERHVGVATDEIKLNKYSSTPEQVDNWLEAAEIAWAACQFKETPAAERASLDSLQRGIYLKRDVKKGEKLKREDVFFAIPYQEGQMPSGKFKQGLRSYLGTFEDTSIVADKDYKTGEPLADQEFDNPSADVFEVIHQVKGLLYEGRIAIGDTFSVEISHHYGIEKIKEFGAVIIDCVNRSYCKKLIVQVPGQVHPLHHHKVKEETFQVLHGEILVTYDGKEHLLKPGDQLLVVPGVPHSFTTKTGAIVEEISSTHIKGDSYYEDESINKMDLKDRKTRFELW